MSDYHPQHPHLTLSKTLYVYHVLCVKFLFIYLKISATRGGTHYHVHIIYSNVRSRLEEDDVRVVQYFAATGGDPNSLLYETQSLHNGQMPFKGKEFKS